MKQKEEERRGGSGRISRAMAGGIKKEARPMRPGL